MIYQSRDKPRLFIHDYMADKDLEYINNHEKKMRNSKSQECLEEKLKQAKNSRH